MYRRHSIFNIFFSRVFEFKKELFTDLLPAIETINKNVIVHAENEYFKIITFNKNFLSNLLQDLQVINPS